MCVKLDVPCRTDILSGLARYEDESGFGLLARRSGFHALPLDTMSLSAPDRIF